jgi:hypothetical protein
MKCISLFLILLYTAGFSSTKLCNEDPDFFKYLSGKIGTENSTKPKTIFLQCDTVIVAKGATASLHPNTLLSWADPKPTNTIIIEGVFDAYGTKTERIKIGGHFDPIMLNTVASKEAWAGFVVKPGGSLFLENVSVHGSKTPVQLNQGALSVSKSFFYGAKQFDLGKNEKNQPYIHSIQGSEYIDAFSLEAFLEKQTKLTTVAPTYEIQEPSIFSNKWTYIIPLTLISTGALGYWAYTNEPDPKKKVEGGLTF